MTRQSSNKTSRLLTLSETERTKIATMPWMCSLALGKAPRMPAISSDASKKDIIHLDFCEILPFYFKINMFLFYGIPLTFRFSNNSSFPTRTPRRSQRPFPPCRPPENFWIWIQKNPSFYCPPWELFRRLRKRRGSVYTWRLVALLLGCCVLACFLLRLMLLIACGRLIAGVCRASCSCSCRCSSCCCCSCCGCGGGGAFCLPGTILLFADLLACLSITLCMQCML